MDNFGVLPSFEDPFLGGVLCGHTWPTQRIRGGQTWENSKLQRWNKWRIMTLLGIQLEEPEEQRTTPVQVAQWNRLDHNRWGKITMVAPIKIASTEGWSPFFHIFPLKYLIWIPWRNTDVIIILSLQNWVVLFMFCAQCCVSSGWFPSSRRRPPGVRPGVEDSGLSKHGVFQWYWRSCAFLSAKMVILVHKHGFQQRKGAWQQLWVASDTWHV